MRNKTVKLLRQLTRVTRPSYKDWKKLYSTLSAPERDGFCDKARKFVADPQNRSFVKGSRG